MTGHLDCFEGSHHLLAVATDPREVIDGTIIPSADGKSRPIPSASACSSTTVYGNFIRVAVYRQRSCWSNEVYTLKEDKELKIRIARQ